MKEERDAWLHRPRPGFEEMSRLHRDDGRLWLLYLRITAKEALANPCDVFLEYNKPDSAKTNILAALERGAHVVVGTSGLTEEDYQRST